MLNSLLSSANQILTEDQKSKELNQYGITSLYHMTHIDNLKSILENGLLSHNQAHQLDTLTDISDQQVNARRSMNDPIYGRSLHDYVPCYFNARNPMSYKRRELANQLVILKIKPTLLLTEGGLFTDGNAASNMTCFFNKITDLSQLSWECLRAYYWNDYCDGKRLRCAEMLIPERISIQDISGISVKNITNLKYVRSLLTGSEGIAQEPRLFF